MPAGLRWHLWIKCITHGTPLPPLRPGLEGGSARIHRLVAVGFLAIALICGGLFLFCTLPHYHENTDWDRVNIRASAGDIDQRVELLFIGESIPASANGANSKRVLRCVWGADQFLHPTGSVAWQFGSG